MKLLLILVCCAVLASAEYRATSPMFREFMAKYNKQYETAELHNTRFWTFYQNSQNLPLPPLTTLYHSLINHISPCSNSQLWEAANKEDRGTAWYGMTEFADLSPEEFSEMYLNKVMRESEISDLRSLLPIVDGIDVNDTPDSVDWREKNVVTDVKNQGMCGSCWAF
eukprot:sb/3472430/